jgi:hypothetical protein
MTRLRSSLVLLALVIGALIVSWLQLVRDTHLPVGSSYSVQAEGIQALYEWAAAMGANPRRLQQAVLDPASPPRVLLVVQPETFVSDRDRRAFDAVPRGGGTLVLAGDSFALQAYARMLGVTFEPAAASAASELPIVSHYRLRASGASPLLTGSSGDTLAVRTPYLGGTLVVIATPQPLTNGALRNDDVARFVLREVLASDGVAFDEAHHSYAPSETSQQVTMNDLLFDTAPGRAVVYVACLTFVCLLLANRRLGPAVAERGATETWRTMYEHVQMLAGLYRRAGQFGTVRGALLRHYQRLLAHGSLTPARAAALSDALRLVEQASSEPALIAAAAAADAAASPSPARGGFVKE